MSEINAKYLIRELFRAFLLGVVIFLVVGLINYFYGAKWTGQKILQEFALNQIWSISLYMVNHIILRFYFDRYKQDFWKFNRVMIGLFSGIAGSFVTILILRFTVINFYFFESTESFMAQEGFDKYIGSIVIAAVALMGYYIFYYWKTKQENKVKESRIIAGTASAKFDALKNQLDPHFLFNSLNVLTSLIDENPRQAQKFTTSLSKVYRYVLEQKSKELVSVDEELAFAKTYMNLIKMRFEDSIVIEMPERSSNPEAKVVPLSLQLLLENAVKHNMVTPSRKLYIKILEKDGKLIVENNIQRKQVIKKSSGVGLQNIRQRYHLLTDRKVQIYEDEKQFSVGIPLLTKKQPRTASVQASYIESKKYDIARERVEKLKGFYVHFGIYCIMFFVFIWLNYISTSFPWAIFPIAGWGLGVAGHASEVFGWSPLFNKSWEDRKIKELMDDENF